MQSLQREKVKGEFAVPCAFKKSAVIHCLCIGSGKTCPVPKWKSCWAHSMPWHAQDKPHPAILVLEGESWVFLLDCHGKTGSNCFPSWFGIWFQTAGHTRTSLLPCTHLSGLRIIHLLIFSCSLMKMSETGRWGGRMIESLVHVGCLCFGDGLLRCFSLQLIMEPDFQKYLGLSNKKWLQSFSELPCY